MAYPHDQAEPPDSLASALCTEATGPSGAGSGGGRMPMTYRAWWNAETSREAGDAATIPKGRE